MTADRDTEEGFAELRAMYEQLLPAQRLKIARDRFQQVDSIPNRLVIAVSATEGLARVILRTRQPGAGGEAAGGGVFPPKMGVAELVKATLHASGVDRAAVIEESTWQSFLLAVRMRNFLVHEAGYVNQIHGTRLLSSVEAVFNALQSLV